MSNRVSTPFFVDLDGSLLKSDLLLETLISCLVQNPFLVFVLPAWLMRGKAVFKKELSARARLNVASLPYNKDVLDFLVRQKNLGRTLILATAAHEDLADEIAKHLGIFSRVIASDGKNNLSGEMKLSRILELSPREGFSYIGNSLVDFPIFSEANDFVIVNPTALAQRRAAKLEGGQVIRNNISLIRALVKTLRLHQWLKNTLVFIPLLTAQQLTNVGSLSNTFVAFFVFSLCASGVYVLNDLIDLPSDRIHARKCKRPFASGDLSLGYGFILAVFLPVLGLSISFMLPHMFLIVISVYLAITVAYSFWAKRVVMLDVIILAGLYTIRVIGGAVAIGVKVSFWLLAFSIFLFLSLALVKRCTELYSLSLGEKKAPGRGYRRSDIEYLHGMGVASGYLAVLVLALFINSPEVAIRYSYPQVLWLLCPALLYWLGYIWLMVGRGKVHDDPIVFALTDKPSRIVFGIVIGLSLLAF